MNPFLPRFCLLLASAGLACGQTGGGRPPEVEASPARKFTFPAQQGKAYQLEGSSDGVVWQRLAGPFFGNNKPITHFLPDNAQPAGTKQVRVVEIDPATAGSAPVAVAGKTLSLEKQGGASNLLFLSPDSGVMHAPGGSARTFTYTWRKSGGESAEVQLTFSSFTERVTLEFSGPSLGRYVRVRQSPDGAVADEEAGGFALSARGVWDVTTGGKWSGALAGDSLVMVEGPAVLRLTFGETTGQAIASIAGNKTTASFSYSTDLQDVNVLNLLLDFGGGRSEEYELRLSSPVSGTFKRSRFDSGLMRSQGSGAFSKAAMGPPPPNPVLRCPAPDDLFDDFLDLTDLVSGTATYAFGNGSDGQKISKSGGTIIFTPYTYQYTRHDDRHARLVIVYPSLGGDEIEQIDLTYSPDDDCTGSYKKQSFRNGAAVGDPVTGTFGPGSAPPGRMKKFQVRKH